MEGKGIFEGWAPLVGVAHKAACQLLGEPRLDYVRTFDGVKVYLRDSGVLRLRARDARKRSYQLKLNGVKDAADLTMYAHVLALAAASEDTSIGRQYSVSIYRADGPAPHTVTLDDFDGYERWGIWASSKTADGTQVKRLEAKEGDRVFRVVRQYIEGTDRSWHIVNEGDLVPCITSYNRLR